MADLSDTKANLPHDLAYCIKELSSTLGQHLRLLDAILAVLFGHESASEIRKENTEIEQPIRQAIAPMLQVTGFSCNTLVYLSDAPGLVTRDCYGIARSIVETSINICYILAEGPEVADRAFRHARQKSYRDLLRQSQIGSSVIQLMFSSKPNMGSVEGLESDIKEFTSRTGREKSWTDLSVDDRIEVVGKKFGEKILTSLHSARFMIYRHSSEILHGTLFGALYFFGLTSPRSLTYSDEKTSEYVGQQHMSILMSTIVSVSTIIEVFHLSYGFSWAFETSDTLLKSIYEIPYLRNSDQPKASS